VHLQRPFKQSIFYSKIHTAKQIITEILIEILLITTFLSAQTGNKRPVKIGLALSGGAALGLAHIGVLKVFEREKIPISFIAGNSMGAMVGGVYAAGYSATQIESIAVSADWAKLFSSSTPFGAQYLPERQKQQRYLIQLRHHNFYPSFPSGIIPLQNVEFLLMRLLSNIEYNTYFDFDSLPIPYRAIAVDLVTGHKVELKRGRLSQAIRASIAIPGVFVPEIIDSMQLVDGGVQQYLPVYPLFDFETDFVIAVVTMKKNEETGISLIDVISRTMDIVGFEDLLIQKELADVLIEPNVDPYSHSDFSRVRELIAAGEVAAEAALPEIRSKLSGFELHSQRNQIRPRRLPIIRRINFDGLQVTRESMLRRLLKIEPGMPLDFEHLIEDLRTIFNTMLFSDVNYSLTSMKGDSVDILIEVQERYYGFYALGMRYENTDGFLLGLELGQGNLWGSGASVRAAVHIGNPREIRLGLTGTRIFTLPFGYRLDGLLCSIERSYYEYSRWQADYTISHLGGVAEMGYILGRNAFFNIGLEARKVAYIFPQLPVFTSLPEDEWIVGPTFNLEFNNLNNFNIPTKGIAYKLRVLWSTKTLKAANEFLKISFSAQEYFPLSSSVLINTGLEFGTSFGTLSWDAHFFTGGDDFIGFSKYEFTSQHKLVIHFGLDHKVCDLFNQDNCPLYLQLTSAIGYFNRLDRFLDESNLTDVLYWGLGSGVRAHTPLGPLHLIIGAGDIGKSPSVKDIRLNYSLSLGYEFRYTK